MVKKISSSIKALADNLGIEPDCITEDIDENDFKLSDVLTVYSEDKWIVIHKDALKDYIVEDYFIYGVNNN